MIQDIFPSRFSLDYGVYAPSGEDAAAVFHDGQILLTADRDFPVISELICPEDTEYQFLFSIDGRRYFLVTFTGSYPQADGLSFCPVRTLRELRPMARAFAGYTAWHLFNWYQDTRYCGRCGARMVPGTDERKMVCPDCGALVYPRINPCIIVSVHDGDRLLMTRYAGRSVTWFVLIAGFIEIGETAEDTVRREVMEETGVKVKNIRYFGTQPWGLAGNLILGFTAELDGSDQITLDTGELAEARWFSREEVPVPDDDVSITSALIHAFAEGRF